jgi:hypothetical protein
VGVKRKQHSAEFKARVAMASLSGEKTLAEAVGGVWGSSDDDQQLETGAGEARGRVVCPQPVRWGSGDTDPMASKKTVTVHNLAALGPERLAVILPSGGAVPQPGWCSRDQSNRTAGRDVIRR